MSGTTIQIFEIPLISLPQAFSLTLGGTPYQLVVLWRDAVDAGWCLDIYDQGGAPIACGIPLVTGVDLLAQFAYLDFGGQLWVRSDGTPTDVPLFTNLGQVPGGHLYWVPNQ